MHTAISSAKPGGGTSHTLTVEARGWGRRRGGRAAGPLILGSVKPIGPYVAVQELPPPATGVAAAQSPVQTLRASDRLTGIPVLLHLLPHAQDLPQMPVSPHLLPVVDSGVDGEQAYLVTELPLQARPASDPLLTARGALSALAVLHGQGMAHGGVSAAQLWTLDSGVALAGAGLPWRGDAGPAADLSDLVLTLGEMGALPEALRPLQDQPGSLSARDALARLNSMIPAQAPGKGSQKGQPDPRQRPDLVQRQTAARRPTTAYRPQQSAVVSGPAVSSGAVPDRDASNIAASNTAASNTVPPEAGTDSETSQGVRAAPSVSPSAVSMVSPPPQSDSSVGVSMGVADGSETAEKDVPTGQDTPARGAASGTAARLTSPFSNAPRGHAETPQERRKRQNGERREQTLLDGQAAAARRLKDQQQQEKRAAARAAEQAALGVPVPEPFQMEMGFAPDTTDLGPAAGGLAADGASPVGSPPQQVQGGPAPLRRPAAGQAAVDQAAAEEEIDRTAQHLPGGTLVSGGVAPDFTPAGSSGSAPVASGSGASGRRTTRNLPPIRIGWDEDDSWRVVRTVAQPTRPWGLPRWVLPVLAVTVLLGLVLLWALRPDRTVPVPAAAPVTAPAAGPAAPAPTASPP